MISCGNQVFEHRAAPRNQADVAALAGQQRPSANQGFCGTCPCAMSRKLARRAFRCQQVVARRIASPFADVVADGQEAARGIVEKLEIHRRQFAAAIHQIIDKVELCLRTRACRIRVGDFHSGWNGAEMLRIGTSDANSSRSACNW